MDGGGVGFVAFPNLFPSLQTLRPANGRRLAFGSLTTTKPIQRALLLSFPLETLRGADSERWIQEGRVGEQVPTHSPAR